MKTILIMLCALTISFQSVAQEAQANTETEAKTTEVTESENKTEAETKTEAVAETEAEEETKSETPERSSKNWVTCSGAYLNYVKGLPKAQHKDHLEKWWAYDDYSYLSTKTDEFKFKEEKAKRLEQFNKLLTEKNQPQAILLKVKLGKYDDAKGGFQVTIGQFKDGTLEDLHRSGFSGFIFNGPPSASLSSCKIDPDLIGKAATSVKFKIKNIQKMKFLTIPTEQAKKITSQLGSDRIKTVSLIFNPASYSIDTQKFGKNKYLSLISNIDVTEVTLDLDDGSEAIIKL